MPCHCWRSSVERLHCRAQVMRKKQEPWHWSKQVKRIPHEVQQVPQGTEGRCCSNSSLREKLLKLFNLVIEKARAPSPSFCFSIPEDYCHCYSIPNLKKVVKGWASLPSILIKLHLQQRYLLLICNLSGCIPHVRVLLKNRFEVFRVAEVRLLLLICKHPHTHQLEKASKNSLRP